MTMAGYYSGSRKLHRSRNGEILGVCKGIAEWRDLPVDAVRLVFILLVLFAGMSIWIYFILALILPVEPEQRRSRSSSDENADTDFENLKERVKNMEDEEFDKEKDWENRFTRDR